MFLALTTTLNCRIASTLWEHDYARTRNYKVITSTQSEEMLLLPYDERKEGSDFSLSRRSDAKSRQDLFELCRNSSGTGILKLFVRIPLSDDIDVGAAMFSARSLFARTRTPSEVVLERLVVTIVS